MSKTMTTIDMEEMINLHRREAQDQSALESIPLSPVKYTDFSHPLDEHADRVFSSCRVAGLYARHIKIANEVSQ
jgi:hypothetical protein